MLHNAVMERIKLYPGYTINAGMHTRAAQPLLPSLRTRFHLWNELLLASSRNAMCQGYLGYNTCTQASVLSADEATGPAVLLSNGSLSVLPFRA